jgi:MarR family transcriptional regulator, transcriptional regulator for hemolysin
MDGVADRAPGVDAEHAPTGLSGNLCWLLSQASHVLDTKLAAALDAIQLSPRAQHVLCCALSGEHTQIELARRVGLDKTTMVVTLDELEQAGYAERRPSKTDRRARVVHVTEAGARRVAEADARTQEVFSEVLAPLAPADRTALLASLERLVAGSLAEPVPSKHPVRRRRSG